jgi:hypothetical protein
MGKPESDFHAEPPGIHGEELAGKRGIGKTGLPRKIGQDFREHKLTSEKVRLYE